MTILKTWESVDKIVKKDIITPGQFSKKPTECASCNVVINNINIINGSMKDVKEVFRSEILLGKSEILVIGEANCEIDRQIERAIETMMIFEKSLITLNLSQEGIEQLLTITFEVTLEKVQAHKPIWEWTPEEKYLTALKYKEAGVGLFKNSRWIDAFHKFSKACKILITLEPIPDLELDAKLESDINSLRIVLYNNMAGCHLNRQNYEHTVSLCTKILDSESKNVKALYRRGVAHGNLKNLEYAVADLKNAVTLEPHNRAAKEQFLIYNTKLQQANRKFEDMVRRMFKT